jgi:hypothetical protein
MTTMFLCPSPKGTNNAKLFLNSRGELLDRRGNYWGRSQIMAMDAAMASSVPKKPHNPLASGARNDFDSALKELCGALGLETEEVAGQVGDIIDKHERKQIQEYAQSLGGGKSAGAGAVDRHRRGAGARDEDAEVEQRVRKLLADKGLDEETIEEALEKVRADRAAAKDRLPVPATRGGMGGHLSKDDFDVEYPNNLIDMPDYAPDPNRFSSGYDPLKMRDPARNLPGGGTSRRLSNDAAICASDEEMEALYPGIENVIAGV